MKTLCSFVLWATLSLIARAGAISASLAVDDMTLGASTNYRFSVTSLASQLTDESYFIIEFSSDLGITIPGTLNSCTGVSGFTAPSVPCFKNSQTQVRLNCFACNLASSSYEFSVPGIVNSYYALDATSQVKIMTYDGAGALMDQTSSNAITL